MSKYKDQKGGVLECKRSKYLQKDGEVLNRQRFVFFLTKIHSICVYKKKSSSPAFYDIVQTFSLGGVPLYKT